MSQPVDPNKCHKNMSFKEHAVVEFIKALEMSNISNDHQELMSINDVVGRAMSLTEEMFKQMDERWGK